MRPKLAIVFSLLMLAPLGAVTWLGLRIVGDEQEMIRHRFHDLLTRRLTDVSERVAGVVQEREREVSKLLDLSSADADVLRQRIRAERMVQQLFVVGADGKMVHPPPEGPLNESEREFLTRTERIWKSQESFFKPPDPSTPGAAANKSGGDPAPAVDDGFGSGWYTWYWGNGINFIYWKRDVDGRILGAQLDRLALLSDIVAELPDTDPSAATVEEGRIELVDSEGEPVYVWGELEPEDEAVPTVSIPLDAPLGAWRLRYFASPEMEGDGSGGGMVFGILASLLALVAAMALLALYFIRESGRDAREAKQRVNFVNQVSHELKTPLTNIRMYAELLEDMVDEEDDDQQRYLGVIVSESQRLSRLIGNVLSFARKSRKKLVLRPSKGSIDETIRAVVDGFRPGMDAAGISVETELGAEGTAVFDEDAVGQIIGNLLGNVEKYAAAGGWAKISSRRDGDLVVVSVCDRGPGVPSSAREEIFEPFFRLGGAITEGVAGTGIGLAISRDLARLHGGGLVFVEAEGGGAGFELTIEAPAEKEKK